MLFVFSVILAAALCVNGSSHSDEATEAYRPRTNLLDLYMFQASVEKTVLAFTTSGFQRSDAGPNYSPSSNDVLYQLHIDNDGDAREDLTFQFLFGHKFLGGTGVQFNIGGVEVPIALVAFGKIAFVSNPASMDQSGLNNLEYYAVRLLHGDKYDTHIDDGPFLSQWNDASQTKFVKPVDNVGTKAFEGQLFSSEVYEDYTEHFVYQVRVPGCGKPARMFVGPRREPFSANLGGLFDLFNIEGGITEEAIADSGVPVDIIQNTRFNSLDCNTVVAFVLEVATECLLAKTEPRTHTVQGFASVRKLEHTGVGGSFHRAGAQINRIGNPLVNDLFIGLGAKDAWARAHPKNDGDFRAAILNPVLPALIADAFGLDVPALLVRADLFAALQVGIAGLNNPYELRPVEDIVAADMLRLNTKVLPVDADKQSSMGVLDGDFAGFPNGRRFGDDVVDILLRGLMGYSCSAQLRSVLCSASAIAASPTGVDLATLCARLPSSCIVGTTPLNETQAAFHYTDRSPISGDSFMDHFPHLNPPVPGNNYIDCWRSHGVDAQFRTFANCASGFVRRGCVEASTDPSLVLVTVAVLALLAASVRASSHSEAPGTSKGPRSDLSDVYAFQSSASTTTLIMNVSPMQRSDNGPSYTPLDDGYYYQFHIDNDGDRIEDITFQFKVGSTVIDPLSPLTIVGPVSASANGDVHDGTNRPEHWQLRLLNGEDYSKPFEHGPLAARVGDGKTTFGKPVDHVGRKTFASDAAYNTYANTFIQNIKFPKCDLEGKVFVGPRRESFAIDLGNVFDLVNIRATNQNDPPTEEALLNSAACTALQSGAKNTLDCSTVVSFVIEIPTACLTKGTDPVIGAWASVRKIEKTDAGHVAGDQFTRLGNPLINELFIGLPQKDKFGSTQPKNDGQWLKFISHPTIPVIFETLFPSLVPPSVPRNDLVAILFTGIPGFNAPQSSRKRAVESRSSSDSDEISSSDIIADAPLQEVQVAPPIQPEPPVAPLAAVADILRLNTAIPPTARADAGSMGVFDGDFAGFPNGRRLGDDVVDIYMRAAMGRACNASFIASLPASVGAVVASVCPTIDEPTASLHYTDRAPVSESAFQATFPFLNIPFAGSALRECHANSVNRQAKARNLPGGGCTVNSKDPSCNCPTPAPVTAAPTPAPAPIVVP